MTVLAGTPTLDVRVRMGSVSLTICGSVTSQGTVSVKITSVRNHPFLTWFQAQEDLAVTTEDAGSTMTVRTSLMQVVPVSVVTVKLLVVSHFLTFKLRRVK